MVEQDVVWPHDLAVDIPNGRLYWVDSKRHTLETVTTAGKDRRVLYRFNGGCGFHCVFGAFNGSISLEPLVFIAAQTGPCRKH